MCAYTGMTSFLTNYQLSAHADITLPQKEVLERLFIRTRSGLSWSRYSATPNSGSPTRKWLKYLIVVFLHQTQSWQWSKQGIYNGKLGRNYNYDEELVVPIIENTCWESDLESYLRDAMMKYPETRYNNVDFHSIFKCHLSFVSQRGVG